MFSSEAPGYVGPRDERFVQFANEGKDATRIPTDGELAHVLMAAGLPQAVVQAATPSDWTYVPASWRSKVLRAMGCRVISARWPGLDGVYSVSAADLERLALVADGDDALPTGFAVPDASGNPHPADQQALSALSAALSGYARQLAISEMVAATGGNPTWPKQPVEVG